MQISMRLTLILVVAVAFLFGSHEALPYIGRCTSMEYFCALRKCTTYFYKRLQKDPKGDCFTKFNQMKDCVVKVVKYCADSRTESSITRIVDQSFDSRVCLEGPPLISSSSAALLLCSSSFVTKANACGRTYRQIFVADKSNSSLCAEEAKQKKCLKNLIDSDCNISSANRGVLDLGFADYNPFCANNRDPGTTRKDRCYGVEDISGSAGIEASAAIHATAGIEATTGIYATTGIKTTAVIKATAGFNTAASIKIAVLHTLLLVLMFICSFPNY